MSDILSMYICLLISAKHVLLPPYQSVMLPFVFVYIIIHTHYIPDIYYRMGIVCMYVCMYVRVCVRAHACLRACMQACMYVSVCVRAYECRPIYICMHACMHTCVCIIMCVCRPYVSGLLCMHVCTCIYVCMNLNLFRTLSSWGSSNYRPSAPFLYEVASHVKKLPFRPLLLLCMYVCFYACMYMYVSCMTLYACALHDTGSTNPDLCMIEGTQLYTFHGC